MKEITRVITTQITVVETMTEDDVELVVSAKADAEKNVAETLQKLYSADNVNVAIQDFVRDKE